MFRRYTETDSRPLTPAPTLASGKSRGSRRCLTPDETYPKTAIVLDLRRSHSQETVYCHAGASELTARYTTSITNEPSTLPSLDLSEGAHKRLLNGQCERLPPLASPLVLSKRTSPAKETARVRTTAKVQHKVLNAEKSTKSKTKAESPRSMCAQDAAATGLADTNDSGGEIKRRGKRRRKGRLAGSDRLTSAGLAAHSQQDPETQIAGIGTDSQNPSSRASVAAVPDVDVMLPLTVSVDTNRRTDSFLHYDILKYLHREVDEEAIQTEFDTKRRFVLQEALRTRPDRPSCQDLQTLLRDVNVTPMSLGDWLHIPRVFSRQNAQFSLPIDSKLLEVLTPMTYAATFVTLKSSKRLLYLTVLRKFRPEGYRMPIENIEEGLILMMGGVLKTKEAEYFKSIMDWENYVDEDSLPDDIKLTLLSRNFKKEDIYETRDHAQFESNTIKYRTWCGLCAICERMFGRFPSRDKDPADGMETSDFALIETTLAVVNVNKRLAHILNTIKSR